MNKNQLFTYIEDRIYGNNNGAITGPVLQDVLKKIVEFNSEQEGRQGQDGVGIDNITTRSFSQGSSTGKELIIKLTNNETKSFKLYDGSDGADGAQGPRGYAGRDGINGTDGSDGRDGRDGEDGRDGKDGKDGKDGFQGRKGAAIRGPYDFYSMSSTTRWWCNGEESEDNPDSALWIDIILKDEVYYYCNTTYYGRLAPWNNVKQNWTAGESYEFIATKILLARNAKINFLTNNELYLMDSNGHITGGAAGGNGVNFWAGAEHPSNGKFRVYADGRLVATDAQIKGAITATSLTLRGSDIENYIHNEVDDAFNGFNPDDAIDENQVNDLIRQYLMTVDYVKPSDLNGYFTEDRLRDWFRRNYSAWTEEQIEEIVRRIASSETSSVDEIDLGDGRIKHIAYIGGRSYEWITVDTGDYIILGAVVSGRTGSGLTRFIVDKNGLLQANNAIIYGKVYASEGYFMGSVSATDGYFRGDVTANSLTLGPGCELDIDPSALDIDLTDYYAAGMPWSSNTGLFKVGKDGLLTCKNAIVSGNVYATNGVFKGDVYAKNGSFKGSISAESGYIKNLHFGSATGKLFTTYIDDVVNDKISDALNGEINPDVINNLITEYLENSGFTGYMTQEYFDQWLEQWNAEHSGSPISEESVSALVRTIVGSEISQVIGITQNLDGSLHHVVNIGGREYSWDTYKTEDYMLLGDWTGSSAHTGTGFIVSRNGLLEANNAVIYGKVYASEGYFKGSVSATDGYFRGDVTANSLTLGGSYGNKSLAQYVEGEVAEAVAGEINTDMINSIISDYLDESGFTNFVTTDDYHAFSGYVAGWMAAHSASGITWASISGFAKNLINSELSNAFDETYNSDGSVTHSITLGGREYSWDTYDADDYLLLGNWVSGTTPGSGFSSFLISKKGLLQANNAVIYGKVYASEGYFKGSVSADSGYFRGSVSAENGYFKGSVEATSGKIGSVLITPQGLSATNIHITNNYMWSDNVALKGSISAENGYFSGELKAATGSFSGEVYATALHLGDGQSVGGGGITQEDLDDALEDYYKMGETVQSNNYGPRFSVSTAGLLTCKNAVISGNGYFMGDVYANNGVFNGTVNATDGVFRGKIYATEGEFGGTVRAADIILDGKSLKLNSEGNSFEISNDDITVDFTPRTVTLQGASVYNQTETATGYNITQFTATGDTSITLPTMKFRGSMTASTNQSSSYGQYYAGTYRVSVIMFVTSGSGSWYGTVPSQSNCISYNTGETYVTVGGSNGSWTNSSDLTLGFSSSNAAYSLAVKDGNEYVVGYQVTAQMQNLEGWANQYTASTTSATISFTNTPAVTDSTFFRIGRNGMQIFYEDGASFTAAKKSTGTLMSLMAQRSNGHMCGLKIDAGGVKILRGDGTTAGGEWQTL